MSRSSKPQTSWFIQRLEEIGIPELDVSKSVLRASQYEASLLGGHFVRLQSAGVVKATDGSFWYPLRRQGDCVGFSERPSSFKLGLKVVEGEGEDQFHVESFEWPEDRPLPLMQFSEFVTNHPVDVTYYYLDLAQREKIWEMETAYWKDFTTSPTYVNFYEGVSAPLLKKAEASFPHLIGKVLKSEVGCEVLESCFAPEDFESVAALLRRHVEALSHVKVQPKHEDDPGLEVCLSTCSAIVPPAGRIHLTVVRAFHFRSLEGKGTAKEICQLSRLKTLVAI